MTTDDLYHDIKVYHKAYLIDSNGHVSPLCADRPRKLNLRKELWTFQWAQVTCKECLAKREVTP